MKSRSTSPVYFIYVPLTIILIFSSCNRSPAPSTEAIRAFDSVIPKPISADQNGKTFFLTSHTTVVLDPAVSELNFLADYLIDNITMITSLTPTLSSTVHDTSIVLALDELPELGLEGYRLHIDEHQIKIIAAKPAGIFYGIQTLRQLIAYKRSDGTQPTWQVATGNITDYPQYAWRGAMLDVARHFFTVEDVKRYIDLISYYKINILHLHLTDDQGWRIEIKSWPNLTAIGGQSQVGGGAGGFYTQAQYQDIVSYAQSRFVTIVPEIDLPGHINAALVSYPDHLLPGTPIRVEANKKTRPVAGLPYTGIDVGFSTLSIAKPSTFIFVTDVIRELAALTPGRYIHIGGDEASVTAKADYITFINRFKEIVHDNEKIMIGWEEIAQADIDTSSIVQHWHTPGYAKMAADKGAKIVMSPSNKIYLDMKYDSTSRIGLRWAGYIDVDDSYTWDPATLIPGIAQHQILGVEAPLWTETVVIMDDIEYLVFPRMPGVAEIGWTPAPLRDWNDYRQRLAYHAAMWNAIGINFYRSKKIDWIE